MLVSFCVIAYNEEKTIESLFHDIKMQDYPHEKMEVILVDSSSTDKTKELMLKFSKENTGFKKVTVLENEKKIQAAGWNVAIQAAEGDIIIRVDAHAMIPKEFVSQNVICIKSGEYVSGGPRPNIIKGDSHWNHTLLLAELSMFGSSIAPFRKGQHKRYVKSVFHGAYRKEVFQKVGKFNENLGRTEDNEMHYRIRKAGYKICYNPHIISYQHTRNSWRGMIRQKIGNGYWIGLTLGICPKCFSIYHFVPFCFVLALTIALILAFCGITKIILLLMGIYLLVNLIMSIIAIYKEKFYIQYLAIPIIFFSLHVAYGLGTLFGIVKMPFWRKKYKADGEK